MTAGAPKCPNNVTSTFFNTVHLLPKDLRFEYGGAKLASCLLPRPPSNLVTPLVSRLPACLLQNRDDYTNNSAVWQVAHKLRVNNYNADVTNRDAGTTENKSDAMSYKTVGNSNGKC